MSEKTKILIVDDDPDIRNVLTLLLREEYETAAVSNGADAIAYMKENPETDSGRDDARDGRHRDL